MTGEFNRDLIDVCDRLIVARSGVTSVLDGLTDAELAWGRRGGWSIARVLDHLLQSEWHYVGLLQRLRNQSPAVAPPGMGPIVSVAAAQRDLQRAREALLAALDGTGEDEFYRLQPVGREEYSVLSLLENVELHDQEHGAQVAQIRQANSQ